MLPSSFGVPGSFGEADQLCFCCSVRQCFRFQNNGSPPKLPKSTTPAQLSKGDFGGNTRRNSRLPPSDTTPGCQEVSAGCPGCAAPSDWLPSIFLAPLLPCCDSFPAGCASPPSCWPLVSEAPTGCPGSPRCCMGPPDGCVGSPFSCSGSPSNSPGSISGSPESPTGWGAIPNGCAGSPIGCGSPPTGGPESPRCCSACTAAAAAAGRNRPEPVDRRLTLASPSRV